MRVRVWVIVVGLPLVALLPVFIAYGAVEKQTKKVVFLWSPAPGHHPNRVSCELLMECLENSPNIKGIKCESYDTWPENPGVLDDAAAIVIYSEGINEQMKKEGKPHPVFNSPKRLQFLDKLMKKGVGMVCSRPYRTS